MRTSRRISDRGNRQGGAYALTTFARVQDGLADELEAYLEGLDARAVFGRVDTLHTARVHLFRDLVYQGPEQRKRDTLRHAHLVFTSTIDGPLDAYLDALRERVPECDEWWGRCVGYPGRGPRFNAWIRSLQARPGLFESAMPDATVLAVRDAVALRERVIDFAAGAQGLDGEELRRRFRATF